MEEERRSGTSEALLTGIGVLQGKMDAQQNFLSELNKTILRQNGRIGKLEQWRNGIVVTIGLGAFIISVFGGRVWDSFQNNRWKASDQEIYSSIMDQRLAEIEKRVSGESPSTTP